MEEIAQEIDKRQSTEEKAIEKLREYELLERVGSTKVEYPESKIGLYLYCGKMKDVHVLS
ncbi:MAG TPA: hypothetical protein VK957_20955 [Lunatimonas sp.]|nr:hypothetical protein [Lunatimonas sp.]